MMWITAIATKVGLWLLPRLLGGIVRYLEHVLDAVSTADGIVDPAQRRAAVLAKLAELFPLIPAPVRRFSMEAVLIVYRLGITPETLEQTALIVSDPAIMELSGNQRRRVVLEQMAALFPSLPERCARLLVEVVAAKLNATV
ncbi:MAG: hypothetical protein AB1646_19705 [Thermodesulfobacteriota bacterium]